MRLKTLVAFACAAAASLAPAGAARAERARATLRVSAVVAARCDVAAGADLDGFLRLTCDNVATRAVRVVTADGRVMVDIQF